MTDNSNSISSDEARKNWSQVLQRAHWGGEHISVTLHGKPHVRIVSEEWYQEARAAWAALQTREG